MARKRQISEKVLAYIAIAMKAGRETPDSSSDKLKSSTATAGINEHCGHGLTCLHPGCAADAVTPSTVVRNVHARHLRLSNVNVQARYNKDEKNQHVQLLSVCAQNTTGSTAQVDYRPAKTGHGALGQLPDTILMHLLSVVRYLDGNSRPPIRYHPAEL